MMQHLWALVLMLAMPVHAETISVASGEHADFSRLVLALPAPQDWRLGRTADGYELTLEGGTAQYDVSGVFDRIPKTRLTGIFADPTTGNLHLTIGCTCHAVPFSLDEKTIVIDLRNGSAPPLSSFETALNGQGWPALTAADDRAVRPKPRPLQKTGVPAPVYDWVTTAAPDIPPATPFPMPRQMATQDGLRETLVAQLAEGAARNVISLAVPDGEMPQGAAPYLPDSVPVRLTSSLGLQIGTQRVDPAMAQPDGQACLPETDLDLVSWGPQDDAPPYAGLFTGLIGEFDAPQQDEVMAAAKRLIYMGFGAEARALLNAFAAQTDAVAVLKDLTYLVDGDAVRAPHAFGGMATCDTAAAFWALMAEGGLADRPFASAAVSRAFSALPPHLRTHLGPQIVEILLDSDAHDLALQIGDSMGRGQMGDTRAVALVTSDVLMAEGEAESALLHIEEVMADPGQMQAEALVALVQARIAAAQPVAPDVADTIAALIEEYTGHPLHDKLVGAYGLALAGSGQFAQARRFADAGHPLDPVFWTMLATNADDDTLLLQAMQPPENLAALDTQTIVHITDRLAGLGFAAAAKAWGSGGLSAMTDVALTMPMAEPHAPPLLSPAETATAMIGAVAAAPEPQPAAGADQMADDVTRMARWNQNWAAVATEQEGAWGQLANSLAAPVQSEAAATLASATATLTKSQDARALIADILQETQENAAMP